MKTDSDIKRDVEAELQSDPSIDATDIAVAVKNGVVTLSGFVRSYAEKLEAEAAADHRAAQQRGGLRGDRSDFGRDRRQRRSAQARSSPEHPPSP